MKQIFISHTKKDKRFCDTFDTVCARVGIRAFRSEFEDISIPAWETIKNAMGNSIALFFLVGKQLVKLQELSDTKWTYTQNWIAYEMGLACQLGIDVWAVCDDVEINFPMPYINNYSTVSLRQKTAFKYLRSILEKYKEGQVFPYPNDNIKGVVCPYENCKMGFNLHVRLPPGYEITCPQCLRKIVFEKGFK